LWVFVLIGAAAAAGEARGPGAPTVFLNRRGGAGRAGETAIWLFLDDLGEVSVERRFIYGFFF
jgi:hypothetical protein